MCGTMSNYKEEREKTASVTMQIAIHAGDVRNLIMEALDHTVEGLYDQTEDKFKEARGKLRQAHIFQTEVAQSEAGGKKYGYPPLFTYTQDTVMTIRAGVNLAKKIISMYRKPDDRISKLGEKAEV